MVPIKKLLDTIGTLDTLCLNCANCVKCAMQIFLRQLPPDLIRQTFKERLNR